MRKPICGNRLPPCDSPATAWPLRGYGLRGVATPLPPGRCSARFSAAASPPPNASPLAANALAPLVPKLCQRLCVRLVSFGCVNILRSTTLVASTSKARHGHVASTPAGAVREAQLVQQSLPPWPHGSLQDSPLCTRATPIGGRELSVFRLVDSHDNVAEMAAFCQVGSNDHTRLSVLGVR